MFRPAINEILSFLPPPNTRQTLLYSATVPADLVRIAPEVLAAEFFYVDTVNNTSTIAKASGQQGGKGYVSFYIYFILECRCFGSLVFIFL